jgi:hypothetical protein
VALIEWKQINGELKNSGNLTGSLYLSGSQEITGSLRLELQGVEKYFAVNINGEPQVEINNEGVFTLFPKEITPTPVSGGMFYSSSNEFYLGFSI